MDKRLGVVGIVIENRDAVARVNNILSEYAEIIIGRMGIPYREKGINVISLIVNGTNDAIGALTGKLGNIDFVSVASTLTKTK